MINGDPFKKDAPTFICSSPSLGNGIGGGAGPGSWAWRVTGLLKVTGCASTHGSISTGMGRLRLFHQSRGGEAA